MREALAQTATHVSDPGALARIFHTPMVSASARISEVKAMRASVEVTRSRRPA